MSTKKRKPKPPAPIAVETVFDVHMTITVRGAGRDDELAVEELVTALFDERVDEARPIDGLELTIVDAVGFDVRHVCDAVRELACGQDRPIWHMHSDPARDAVVRLADLDRMRFDQPMQLGTACDLALDLMPNYQSGAGAHRLEMVASFVPGLRCLTCGGSGQQTMPNPRGMIESFSRQCPTCEGSGQR